MSDKDICEVYCYDEEKVDRIQKKIKLEDWSGVTPLFKVLADEKRAKIAYSLCQEGELCVCDMANIIGVSVATASHHLRTLHKQGIVNYRKEGKLVFYSLDDKPVKQLITMALAHRKEVQAHV
ncbi:metalloregulator ArsR/SmtB family transcription factor (plasmid) [Bacillus badius]|uniref:ArsR/SmtB family transcription factor n=1 Tax=Bacillus badius TaxID=1455 RepID=UPI001CBC8A2D|nr:metalloregulator ArsR/SmtB family transcription factor [Bacillus badius]UAT33036.1 metalloregulator ArsR/SmtB family transcription factor [Bacillus badius]